MGIFVKTTSKTVQSWIYLIFFGIIFIYIMDPEIKELLEKDIAIDEENNKILKKMQVSSRISLALNITKWVIIIASILGITYWLGPRLETVLNLGTYKELLNLN